MAQVGVPLNISAGGYYTSPHDEKNEYRGTYWGGPTRENLVAAGVLKEPTRTLRSAEADDGMVCYPTVGMCDSSVAHSYDCGKVPLVVRGEDTAMRGGYPRYQVYGPGQRGGLCISRRIL